MVSCVVTGPPGKTGGTSKLRSFFGKKDNKIFPISIPAGNTSSFKPNVFRSLERLLDLFVVKRLFLRRSISVFSTLCCFKEAMKLFPPLGCLINRRD